LGFLKNEFNENKKILEIYKDKYELKKKYCIENNINFIYENDYKLIIKKIIENGF